MDEKTSSRINHLRASLFHLPTSTPTIDPNAPVFHGRGGDSLPESSQASPTDGSLIQPTSTIPSISLLAAQNSLQDSVYGADQKAQTAQNKDIPIRSLAIRSVHNNNGTSSQSSIAGLTPSAGTSEVPHTTCHL